MWFPDSLQSYSSQESGMGEETNVETNGTEKRIQKSSYTYMANGFLTKVKRQLSGERIVLPTVNNAGTTRYIPICKKKTH